MGSRTLHALMAKRPSLQRRTSPLSRNPAGNPRFYIAKIIPTAPASALQKRPAESNPRRASLTMGNLSSIHFRIHHPRSRLYGWLELMEAILTGSQKTTRMRFTRSLLLTIRKCFMQPPALRDITRLSSVQQGTIGISFQFPCNLARRLQRKSRIPLFMIFNRLMQWTTV